jgi:hypothetical protein
MRHETPADGKGISAPGRSYWLVGLALLGLVLAILGVAFILDRQLRPRAEMQPVGAVVEDEPAPLASAERQRAQTPTPPSAAPAAAAAAPTAAPRLLQEIEDAYRRYWDVYSDALFNLDTSRLSSVSADEELRLMREEVEDFRRRGRAVRAVVTHSYLVIDVTESSATVYDEILDSSFLINPVTKQPPEGPDTRQLSKDIFYLKKLDGKWKVVRSLRQEGQRP